MLRNLAICGLLAGLAAGCGDDSQARPIDAAAAMDSKLPPPPNGGGMSTSNCQGVPARGECRGNVVLICDTASNMLRRLDCGAMGKQCVVDTQRGATCESLGGGDGGIPVPPPRDGGTGPDAAPGDGGAGTPRCPFGIDLAGFCWGPVAIWCDPQTGTTYLWNCAFDGLSCRENDCALGAYCCGAPRPDAAVSDAASSECTRLGFRGECAGNTARWCNGSGQIVVLDCTARGQTCQVDTCATGAYCCTPPPPTGDECTRLGIRGECVGNSARWCDSNGTIHMDDCASLGQTCQVDACAVGAYCCNDECARLGLRGECVGNTARWCDSQGVIQTQDCTTFGQTCQLDTCASGAYCCP